MINAIGKRYYYKKEDYVYEKKKCSQSGSSNSCGHDGTYGMRRHAAVAAEMKRPQQPEEILAPQQLAEMRQLPAPARLERPISPLPWAQIS